MQEHDAVLVFNRDGEVYAFTHLVDAANSMESADVLDGDYEAAFTLDGHVVAITGVRDADVSLRVTAEHDDLALRELLLRSQERMGFASDVGDPASVANELIRLEWERRGPHLPRWVRRRIYGDHPPQV